MIEGVSVADALDRFLAKVAVRDDGCWEWTGTRLPAGYGSFWWDGRKSYAHRFAHEAYIGPIPEGLTIDHLCRNKWCVNPAHLEAVTQRVNTLRAPGPASEHAAQVACIHGHPFDAVNTYVAPNGTRKCRECRRTTRRVAYQRLKQVA